VTFFALFKPLHPLFLISNVSRIDYEVGGTPYLRKDRKIRVLIEEFADKCQVNSDIWSKKGSREREVWNENCICRKSY
jgi:hypothetical protein